MGILVGASMDISVRALVGASFRDGAGISVGVSVLKKLLKYEEERHG